MELLEFAQWTSCLLKYDEIRGYRGGGKGEAAAPLRDALLFSIAAFFFNQQFLPLNAVLELPP